MPVEFDIDETMIDSVVKSLEKEDQKNKLSANYVDFLAGIDINNVHNFEDAVNEGADGYMEYSMAQEIIDNINWYILNFSFFVSSFEVMHGAKSKVYQDVLRINSFIKTSSTLENLWSMMKYDRELYDKFIRIICCEKKSLIKRPVLARMAILRIYISNLASKITKEFQGSEDKSLSNIKDAFNIGAVLNELCFARALLDKKTLKIFHSIGARANKKFRDSEKFKAKRDIAEEVWEFGCELLHTQIVNLYLQNGDATSADRTGLRNMLKEIAPYERVYGTGVKRIIETCPCDKEEQCPLAKKINLKKRYTLPVS